MSHLATRPGPSTATPADGSRTIVEHDSQPREDSENDDDASGSGHPSDGILRLRGGPRSRPRVAWTEDVIDNEGMGKKKSKICCIYHKPRRFDESSSESDSSESDDSGSDSGCARPGGRLRHNHHAHRSHPHPHHQGREGGGDGQVMRDSSESGMVQEFEPNESEPNAYERPPGSGKGKGKKGKEFDSEQA